MKQTFAFVGWVLFLISVGFLLGSFIIKNSTVDTTSTAPTDNMRNCQEQGGRYNLSIYPNGDINYENCEIKKMIDYKNKN